MYTSGFHHAPVSRLLTYGLVASSLLASLLDKKHYFYIQVAPHFWQYGQFWRALAYQLCYTSSPEVLFGAMTIYHMRVIERLWGTRKYLSFLVVAYLLSSVLPPALLALVLRPLSLQTLNYLPAGPTPLIFAMLSQYHAAIPQIYKFRIATSPSSRHAAAATDDFTGITLSDKTYVYLPAVQLALSQFPGSLLGAVVGWAIGLAWRNAVLPGRITDWRVPGWLVGMRHAKRSSREFEQLRQRLESEGGGTGAGERGSGDPARRRVLGQQLLDQFR